jgi:hypothetical protein
VTTEPDTAAADDATSGEHADGHPAAGSWASDERLRQVGRWGIGMVVTTGRYAVHRVPFYRRNRRPGCDEDVPDLARDLPGGAGRIQRAGDGLGPLYHRRYEIAFTDSELTCEQIVSALRDDPNTATLRDISRFEPIGGTTLPFDVGDELIVRLPGPWNGPVRVVEVTERSFRLVTLDGHMEAGEISFTAAVNERGWIVFRIESWARAGDALFNLLYHRLPVARELQLHMWSHFCESVVRMAGGVVMTNVELHTCNPGESERC